MLKGRVGMLPPSTQSDGRQAAPALILALQPHGHGQPAHAHGGAADGPGAEASPGAVDDAAVEGGAQDHAGGRHGFDLQGQAQEGGQSGAQGFQAELQDSS